MRQAKPVYDHPARLEVRHPRHHRVGKTFPKAAQDYVLFIEQQLGAHISIVSTGPKRHEVIYR